MDDDVEPRLDGSGTPDEWERLAEERELLADQRELLADRREQHVDARERVLDRWEAELAEQAASMQLDDTSYERRRAAAREQRAAAHRQRRHDADARYDASVERQVTRQAGSRPPGDDGGAGGSPARFARLATELRDADDLGDLVAILLEAAVDAVPGCEAASIALVADGRLTAASSSASWAGDADAHQLAAGSGPLVDAFERGVVATDDLTTDERWVELHPLRDVIRARSAISCDLVTAGNATGTITFYSRLVGAFEGRGQQAAEVLAAHATVALERTHERLSYEARYEAWQHALESRDLIGQAKGILMAERGIDADEAFRELRALSQARNLKIRDLAEHLVKHRRFPD